MLRSQRIVSRLLLCYGLFCACQGHDRERTESKFAKRQKLNINLFSKIQADLKPWKEAGITLEQVERTYCTEFKGGYVDGGFRLQILEGEMFVVGEIPGYAEFNRHVKLFLLDVARHHKLPDVDLVLSTSDACHPPGLFNGSTTRCSSLAPIFVYGKKKGQDHCVTYPDHTFAGWPTVNLPSWQDLWDLMEGKQQHSWAGRVDSLYFRGAMTGNRAWLNKDKDFLETPQVDVSFSRWTGDPAWTFVSLPEHCNYRYLLHLPGQAYSSRLKNLLLCKSTVIFPRDGNDEFWYHLLEDGVSMVFPKPLQYQTGGASILAALETLQSDPQKAEQIAATGHELVRRALRPDNVRRYFAELIRAYADLQRFRPTRHPDAVPFYISAISPDRNMTQAARTCSFCQV